MTVFLMIFRRFPTTFQRFPKIVPKARRTFPNVFWEFTKTLGRPGNVSMIYQLFEVQFKRQTWYQWNHRYLHMWGYRNVFMNLLTLGIQCTTDFYIINIAIIVTPPDTTTLALVNSGLSLTFSSSPTHDDRSLLVSAVGAVRQTMMHKQS